MTMKIGRAAGWFNIEPVILSWIDSTLEYQRLPRFSLYGLPVYDTLACPLRGYCLCLPGYGVRDQPSLPTVLPADLHY